jgi:hypothetical protein
MAKFIVGVVVGIFLGASASAYGAVAPGSCTLSGWAVAKDGEDVCVGRNTTEASGSNGSHSWRANLSR